MKLMISIISLLIAMNVVALPKSMHEKVVVLPQTDGWVDVPLTDKNPFDPLCKYRMVGAYNPEGGRSIPGATIHVVYFPMHSSDGILYASFVGLDASDVNKISYYDKTQVIRQGRRTDFVLQLQKRCQTIPAHQVALFNLRQCPAGWKKPSPTSKKANDDGYITCEKL